MLTQSSIPYGVSRFTAIREGGLYYVDKTAYIRRLEERAKFVFFVRPRRFGKSLFIDTLRAYYDIAEKPNFARYFGGLAIGRNPTAEANSYQVLVLDFSRVALEAGDSWQSKFESYMDSRLREFLGRYHEFYASADFAGLRAGSLFSRVIDCARSGGAKLYLVIDEYDNFTNELVAGDGRSEYLEITHRTGFYRAWFKGFKGSFDRIFMTGVSPVTMDDLTSGFNIATNISANENFNAMLGFTADEVKTLLAAFHGAGRFTGEIERHFRTMEKWYDGYVFSRASIGREHVFNSDMVLYYLSELVDTGRAPEKPVDGNIRSDWAKLRLILSPQHSAETELGALPLTEELAERGEAAFELVDSFPIERITDCANFKSLYYYYGIVTMGSVYRGELHFRVPNECVKRQIFDFMREEYARRGSAVDEGEFSALFSAFAWDGEFRPLFEYLAARFKSCGSSRDGVNSEPLLNGFMRSYLMMKSVYLARPEFELNGRFADYAFFPDLSLDANSRPAHSYVIELKHVPANAAPSRFAANHAEALAQLEAYSAAPALESFAAGTRVHFLDIEFRGRDMIRCDEVEFPRGRLS